jgi:branched-subunit amino acid aminotransferase/4-amino-4-deoxychorismate lyase
LKLINYNRDKPDYKNLKYQVILKYLSKMDPRISDIGLCNKKQIFESGTANILFIKKDYIFSPIDKIYKGVTLKFFKNKMNKFIMKNISIKSLYEFDEIILIGTGKGVTSVKTINDIKWRRKSLKFYKILKKLYKTEIKKCSIYR